MNDIMKNIVNDKKGYNIVNDNIAALLRSQTAYLLRSLVKSNS